MKQKLVIISVIAGFVANLGIAQYPPDHWDRARYGPYFWAGSSLVTNPGPNFLLTGAQEMENLGAQSIRIVMHCAADIFYGTGGCTQGIFSLTQLAKRTDYHTILSNPQFRTIMFSIRDYATYGNCGDFKDASFLYPKTYTAQKIQQIEKEYADLAKYLSDNFPDKTFILSHWEGDNLVYAKPYCSTDTCFQRRAEGFKLWMKHRTNGIRASGAKNVFNCLEFNAPGGGQNNLIADVIPHVDVDYYSYSSWGAVNRCKPDDNTEMKQYIHDIRKRIAAAGKDTTRFILGEYGFKRKSFDPTLDVKRHQQAMLAIKDLNIPYAFIWDMYDADGLGTSPFGLQIEVGQNAPAGDMYCKFWRGKMCTDGLDGGLTFVVNPRGTYTTNDLTPRVRLRNFGPEVITSATIYYNINGGATNAHKWTGYLVPGSVTPVDLPKINVANGNHTFNASIAQINNKPDSYTINNIISSSFAVNAQVKEIHDAGISGIVEPVDTICVQEVKPKVILKNYGKEIIDAVEIHYQVDNGKVVTRTIQVPAGTGLKPGNTSTLTLPVSTISPGQHNIKVYTTKPNGKTDADPTNNENSMTFVVWCPVNNVAVTGIDYPNDTVCADSISPKAVIKNLGSSSLDSITVEYQIDNGPVLTREFGVNPGTGVTPGNSITLALPRTEISPGNHVIKITAIKPNGKTDANPSDNSFTSGFNSWCPSYDVAILSMEDTTTDFICTSGIKPRFLVWNKGNHSLSHIEVNFSVNGQPPSKKIYSVPRGGGVPAGDTASLSTDSIDISSYGNYTLTIFTGNPNHHLDMQPTDDTIHYKFTSSCAIGVVEYQYDQLIFHPNPTSGQLYIQLVPNKGIVEIAVFSCMGRKVFDGRYLSEDDPVQIDLDDQPPGMYLVQVTMGENRFYSKVVLR